MAAGDQTGRSPELDKVRELLFPGLSAEEGWARIDAAVAGAADDRRLEAIEALASRDMNNDLIAALRILRDRNVSP
jgi:alkylhydroperoxidase/carboxymuconolactone decarboxylase family protein YurZ